jgi:hypothetical protein
MFSMLKKYIILIVLIIAVIILIISRYDIKKVQQVKEKYICNNINVNYNNLDDSKTVSDFKRYECKNRIRIGGEERFVKKAKSNLWRIDGAWYICADDQFKLIKNSCTVYSFGIHLDYTFDIAIKTDYGCQVYSFDPFVEAPIFTEKRKSNIILKDSYELKIDDKWTFYRVGIAGFRNSTRNEKKVEWLATLDQILDLTKQRNKIIDIFKMDVEGAEKGFLEALDMNYACQYFKQFVFEGHFVSNEKSRIWAAYKLIKKLEICFLLFHRDTRFFMHETWGETGHMTEFQNPNEFKLEIKGFESELELTLKMFINGELHFINRNFL